jgi:hypothetical protein
MTTTLPADSDVRKGIPLLSGLFNYFPAALAGVARWSKLGNDKHNPGEPLHHARGKSMDHGDCILRHTMDLEDWKVALDARIRAGTVCAADVQALLDEADARCWRSLAESQELHEKYADAPLAPAARLPAPTATNLVNSDTAEALRGYDEYAADNNFGVYVPGNVKLLREFTDEEIDAMKAADTGPIVQTALKGALQFTKAAWLCARESWCMRPTGHPGECVRPDPSI